MRHVLLALGLVAIGAGSYLAAAESAADAPPSTPKLRAFETHSLDHYRRLEVWRDPARPVLCYVLVANGRDFPAVSCIHELAKGETP
jgi:hypothetical protein